MLNKLPAEVKNLPLILWQSQEVPGQAKPTKLPINAATGHLASVTNPAHWNTLPVVLQNLHRASGAGAVLIAEAGLVCIDLDATDDPAEIARQKAIVEAFDSYTEISPSGRGVHIWIKARIASGRRRGCVEMYHEGRYMTITGQVYLDRPVRECQELATSLWEELQTKEKSTSTIDEPEVFSDHDIMMQASSAVNGQKFMDLFDGKWQLYYEDDINKISCNEADFALINIISFYTHNRAQITRIFRASALGKRDKAKRQAYLDYMLDRTFDRIPAPLNLDTLHANLQLQLAAVKAESVQPVQLMQVPAVMPVETREAVKKHRQPVNETSNGFEYSLPPGLLGEIAAYIYSAAPRPVKEIAIAGAIGLLSGVCGRSYNISSTGLNNYVLVLAMTGAGKEGCASGIDKLMTEVVKTVPDASRFIGPGEIASPQALQKFLSSKSNCFMSLVGEFGIKFRQLCGDRASTNDIGLKRIFLDLYNKSGRSSILKPLIYSDKDKNTEAIHAPAFSMLGETTPETFYENLDSSLISDGLLPRFTIIEYKGKRPELNELHAKSVPSTQLMDRFAALCAYSLQLNNGNNALEVGIAPDALKMFKDFDKHCDNQINHASNDVTRQLWNRAHIKSLKLAALLAVGVNYIQPVINVECATWALQLITQDVLNLLGRFESGEIGVNNVQNDQATDIKKVIKKYVSGSWDDVKKYAGCSEILFQLKIIPHSYITACCRQRASFKNDRLGPVPAIGIAIKSLVDCGEIVELSPLDKKSKNIGDHRAKLYVISGMQL